MTQAEQQLAAHLHDDVIASYRLHDEGFLMQFPPQMTILPLEGIASCWQILEKLRHDESWVNQPLYYFTEEALRFGPPHPGPIQPVWWHEGWIPIADDLGSNLSSRIVFVGRLAISTS